MPQVLKPYTGKTIPHDSKDRDGLPIEPYVPRRDVVEVVNLALAIGRPILLKGEPGCGKTRLARAVAWELGRDYFEWNVKSTSRALDGLYSFDAVGRLRDTQVAHLDADARARAAAPASYVRHGALGKAFRSAEPAVVLIDEIDKADIDFPNDLLHELDQSRFKIEETGEEVVAATRPLVFITSNAEKDLPDAFLRRCLFHYMDFPERAELIDILSAHFGDQAALAERAVTAFGALRDEMAKSKAAKRPATSELVDWVKAILAEPEPMARLAQDKLPFPSILLKTQEDRDRYHERFSRPAGGA
jgi:MoxR-like ATPase